MSKTKQYFQILHIEDNATNRNIIQLILERRNNLRLSAAEDGTSGVLMARELHPDLILLDISLPDITGYQVLARLKEFPETSTIPVIAISGGYREENAAFPYAFEKYLAKPIEIEPLYQAIDELLAG